MPALCPQRSHFCKICRLNSTVKFRNLTLLLNQVHIELWVDEAHDYATSHRPSNGSYLNMSWYRATVWSDMISFNTELLCVSGKWCNNESLFGILSLLIYSHFTWLWVDTVISLETVWKYSTYQCAKMILRSFILTHIAIQAVLSTIIRGLGGVLHMADHGNWFYIVYW